MERLIFSTSSFSSSASKITTPSPPSDTSGGLFYTIIFAANSNCVPVSAVGRMTQRVGSIVEPETRVVHHLVICTVGGVGIGEEAVLGAV